MGSLENVTLGRPVDPMLWGMSCSTLTKLCHKNTECLPVACFCACAGCNILVCKVSLSACED